MTVDDKPFGHCLIRKHNLLNMISKTSATHNTIVITVNVYIAMRRTVFSRYSDPMHFIIVNFLSRGPVSHR